METQTPQDFDVVHDPMGFPMVWLSVVNAYVHWLPFTKIQMEYYLSATTVPSHDEDWYAILLKTNPRVSPGMLQNNNYWQAFITNILPKEAEQLARQSGRGFDLPTADEWQRVYRFLRQYQVDSIIFNKVTANLKPRVKTLFNHLEGILEQEGTIQLRGVRTLADQMAMRLGILEYVYENTQRSTFAVYGQTHINFHSMLVSPDDGYPMRLSNPAEGGRVRHHGFRLIQRRW